MKLMVVLLASTALALASAPVSHMVTVNGAQLEYLDWGGSGPPMVFLAGLSDTPYLYNDLAPEFTSSFHCYGLTRRGHGRSEKTTAGYKLDELVGDIAAFLRTLNLSGVTLVGHSYGGTEVVRFAELYPNLVRRGVVLDIAYTYSEGARMDLINGAGEKIRARFMPAAERLTSLDAYRKYLTFGHRSWSEAAEANMREQVGVGANGRFLFRMPSSVADQFNADRSNWKTTRIPVPALFIFSNNPIADLSEGLTIDADLKKEIAVADLEREKQRRAQIDAIRRDSPQARMVELAHTPHRNFVFAKDRVVQEMWQFLR